ncbi:MAG: cyclase family protein [Candidatus Bathyarchaeota archaeon]
MSLESTLRNYRVIDLSHRFEEEMPRPQVPYGHIPWKSYAKGDAFNTNMFLVFEHSGTHVDAPIHLGGVEGPSIDEIPPEMWMGPCSVLDMSHKGENEEVSAEDIVEWENTHGAIERDTVALFHYGWDKNWTTKYGVEKQPYLKNNPGLSEDAAHLLAERGVKLVGGDTPTIDSDANPTEPAHRVLLPRHILVLENAKNLGELPPKGAYFIGLPLRIKDGTGCPVRAIALVPR